MKITIAVPQAPPIMATTEEEANAHLYIQYGDVQLDSMEDVFMSTSGGYISLKTQEAYGSLPYNATELPTGSIVTLTQE